MKTEVEAIASNVQGAVIANSGHWIMEEQPQQAIAAITGFLKKEQRAWIDGVMGDCCA
jgi:pimeloyl-ACP methyl ester carboxylesterase